MVQFTILMCIKVLQQSIGIEAKCWYKKVQVRFRNTQEFSYKCN